MQNKTRLLLLSLSLAVFGVITTEVAVIGLLPQLMHQLHINAPQVGFLISIYAIVVAISGTFITLLLGKYNRKKILLVIMLLFIISNAIYALTNNYYIILIFRVLPALTHAVFFAIALNIAANAMPPAKSTQGTAIVFSGVAIGMVLGMPLSAFIAQEFSLSAAFWFGALTSLVAFIGIFLNVPSINVTAPLKIHQQIKILNNVSVWLSILTITLIFSTMFATFSYIADYLIQITHFSNNITSTLLILFGISGYIGNFIFSYYLQRDPVKTTLRYPLLFGLIYLFIWFWGYNPFLMVLFIILWGILHTSGLIISQNWLMREASAAPEFANSLYISFSNLGITIGTIVGGWIMPMIGVESIMWIGIIFAFLAFTSIWLKVNLQAKEQLLADKLTN
ncbi:MAG: MFS transporter [Providencia sp.]|uniref:MFS transporter n=1 Tax=Providencia sp. TaxID=589 RepID=UPI003F9A3C08